MNYQLNKGSILVAIVAIIAIFLIGACLYYFVWSKRYSAPVAFPSDCRPGYVVLEFNQGVVKDTVGQTKDFIGSLLKTGSSDKEISYNIAIGTSVINTSSINSNQLSQLRNDSRVSAINVTGTGPNNQSYSISFGQPLLHKEITALLSEYGINPGSAASYLLNQPDTASVQLKVKNGQEESTGRQLQEQYPQYIGSYQLLCFSVMRVNPK